MDKRYFFSHIVELFTHVFFLRLVSEFGKHWDTSTCAFPKFNDSRYSYPSSLNKKLGYNWRGKT